MTTKSQMTRMMPTRYLNLICVPIMASIALVGSCVERPQPYAEENNVNYGSCRVFETLTFHNDQLIRIECGNLEVSISDKGIINNLQHPGSLNFNLSIDPEGDHMTTVTLLSPEGNRPIWVNEDFENLAVWLSKELDLQDTNTLFSVIDSERSLRVIVQSEYRVDLTGAREAIADFRERTKQIADRSND